MYVVYINLLYFLSIFLFTYNKNLLSQNLIIGLKISYYISKFAENCSADKVSYNCPSTYYHFFSIAIVNSRNRVFFRTY